MRAPWPLSLLLLIACDASHLNGTALLISPNAGFTELQQLRYQATDELGAVAFGPDVRPEVPAGRQPSVTVVRVLLPDSADGQVLEVHVEGLSNQAMIVEGRALVRVERGLEVAVAVELTAPSACAACAGCCSPAGACLNVTAAACGARGAACVSCDQRVADTCGLEGTCTCGARAPCGAGTRCSDGACVCDPTTCSGCCSANGECLSGDSRSSCGQGGVRCDSCDRRCSRGTCE